jgi:geranylgeranyl pyrophosphate synthase
MQVGQALKAVDDLMIDVVESEVEVLQSASRHIIGAGGKRIRPNMLFLIYEALGGQALESAIPVAAAIELVHTATLVHDDINDHGVVRRGRVTVNERWGRTFALLTGDYLFTKVYELMAPYGDLNITLAEATVALVEGETLQADAAKRGNLNREVYQQIVAKKTASLFRASGMLGAQLADATHEQIDVAGEFGFYLGLAFQIVDDILDLEGDPLLMGKASNVDVQQGKGVATAYSGNTNGVAVATAPAQVLDTADDEITELKRRLVEQGALEEGRQMAEVLSMQARMALSKLPPGPAIDALDDLVELVVNRDR